MLIRIMSEAQTIKGEFWVRLAWANQKPLATTERINIHIDMSAVILVLNALKSWGNKMMVVNMEANQPSSSAVFIDNLLNG